MILALITGPAEEPVSLSEAKAQVRVTHDLEDELIAGKARSARSWVESFTNRALVTQTWELRLPGFPPCGAAIELPRPPLASVTSVTYVDVAGAAQTWAPAKYQVLRPAGDHADRGRIVPAYGETYPTARGDEESVVVRFVCGYGAAGAVPQALKDAVLLKLGDLYTRRESGLAGAIFAETRAAEQLLWPFRSVDF